MRSKEQCLGCSELVRTTPNIAKPYTIYLCNNCGNYSLHNDLVELIHDKNIILPEPKRFQSWVQNEEIMDELKGEGPLITEGTIRLILRRGKGAT